MPAFITGKRRKTKSHIHEPWWLCFPQSSQASETLETVTEGDLLLLRNMKVTSNWKHIEAGSMYENEVTGNVTLKV